MVSALRKLIGNNPHTDLGETREVGSQACAPIHVHTTISWEVMSGSWNRGMHALVSA